MPAKPPKLGLLTMFGRRMRAWWEGNRGVEFTEPEFVQEMLVGGFVEKRYCKGCGDLRNVLNGFLCADCNKRCVRPQWQI